MNYVENPNTSVSVESRAVLNFLKWKNKKKKLRKKMLIRSDLRAVKSFDWMIINQRKKE